VYRITLDRPAAKVALVILGLAFTSSFVLYLCESLSTTRNSLYGRSYLETLKAIVVLLCSGYDVQPPGTTLGWVCAIFAAFLGIAFVAVLTADLASVLVRAAMHGEHTTSVCEADHIVFCGWRPGAEELMEQLVSEDQDQVRTVVIVDDKLDSVPFLDPYVKLVKGDPTEKETLERASVARSSTAIIPSDWRLPEPQLRDSKCALSMLAVESINEHVYTCVELVSPDSERHLRRTKADEVVCVGRLARRLLVQAALSHGISRLLEDIVTFNQGSEVYKVALPRHLAGSTFRELLAKLSEEHGTILLSVERDGTFHTNPQGRFTLRQGDTLLVLAESYPYAIERLSLATSSVWAGQAP